MTNDKIVSVKTRREEQECFDPEQILRVKTQREEEKREYLNQEQERGSNGVRAVHVLE